MVRYRTREETQQQQQLFNPNFRELIFIILNAVFGRTLTINVSIVLINVAPK